MKSYRKTATFAGILFLIAMVGSLAGGGILEPIFNTSEYLLNVTINQNLLKIGIILEFANALAVIGIATLLFPVIKSYSEQFSIGYLSLRIMESISCFAAAIIPISVISFGEKAVNAEAIELQNIQVFADLLLSVRTDLLGILLPLFFSAGALIFYTFLYKKRLLPRFIPVWGFIGVVGVVALNLINFENSFTMVLALPIILNEIILGIWLIVKGFHLQELYTNHNKRS